MAAKQYIIHALKGAMIGLGSAVWIDYQEWQKTPDLAFDFKPARKRWLCGLITGLVGGLGFSHVG